MIGKISFGGFMLACVILTAYFLVSAALLSSY